MTLEVVWDGTETRPPGHTKGVLLNDRASDAGWWHYLVPMKGMTFSPERDRQRARQWKAKRQEGSGRGYGG